MKKTRQKPMRILRQQAQSIYIILAPHTVHSSQLFLRAYGGNEDRL
jgi:hypothetical protein